MTSLSGDYKVHYPSIPEEYDGLTVTVLGLARSGVAAAELLANAGANVFASDATVNPRLKRAVETLENVEWELGGHSERCFRHAKLVVKSPGIPETAPVIKRFRKMGIPVIGEVELAWQFSVTPWIAITGSNGKSTTTAMTGEILEAAGFKTAIAGNIGNPLSEVVGGLGPDDRIVAEISSFQLENIRLFKPEVAVILNITPDHLDRHGSMEKYAELKLRIFGNMDDPGKIVVNEEDTFLVGSVPKGVSWFSGKKIPSKGKGVGVSSGRIVSTLSGISGKVIMDAEIQGAPGPHNVANATAAACAAILAGADPDSVRRGLTSFRALPHRLEIVAESAGVKWFNDSKATNVDSVRQALASFTDRVIWIAGGRDKNGDFESLAELVEGRVKIMLLIGEAAEKIGRTLGRRVPTIIVSDMKQAVKKAESMAVSGDTILLSPGCTSFDQYSNFEERGEDFRSLAISAAQRMKTSYER